MKTCVSNIAFSRAEHDRAIALLRAYDVDALEIAPGVAFATSADPFCPSDAEILAFERAIAPLPVVSMQSILFGVSGAALFGTMQERAVFEHAVARAVALAGRLHIPHLVFGSPLQRIVPSDMLPERALEIAVAVFRGLGGSASSAGTRIGIEHNPAAYGGNFLLSFAEVCDFVRAVDHPGVVVTLDLGGLVLDGVVDRFEDVLASHLDLIGHVHLSEPHLAPAVNDPERVARLLSHLERAGYEGAVSVEMRRVDDDLVSLEGALDRLRTARRLVQSASGAAP